MIDQNSRLAHVRNCLSVTLRLIESNEGYKVLTSSGSSSESSPSNSSGSYGGITNLSFRRIIHLPPMRLGKKDRCLKSAKPFVPNNGVFTQAPRLAMPQSWHVTVEDEIYPLDFGHSLNGVQTSCICSFFALKRIDLSVLFEIHDIPFDMMTMWVFGIYSGTFDIRTSRHLIFNRTSIASRAVTASLYLSDAV